MIEFRKLTEAKEFVCASCLKEKKSKNVPVWTKEDGTKVDICNGCYGTMNINGGLPLYKAKKGK